MGIRSERRHFGWYRTNRDAPQWGWVTVADLRPDDVDEFIADVRSYFGDRAVTIEFADDGYTAEIGALIRSAGWTNERATVYLAFTGEPGAECEIDAPIERVSPQEIDEFTRVKLMAFDDSEDEPSAVRMAEDSALRLAEMNGDGRCLLARIDGEPASICAYYEGTDYLIFLLGTRLPFRHRHLARGLVRHVLADAHERMARSVMINADEGGLPDRLYRSLGFTDVVHRRWRFQQAK